MKHLRLRLPVFIRLEGAFGEWLCALGYARSTAYYAPLHVREFFHWLEEQGLEEAHRIDASVVETYLTHLAERANRRRGGGLSPAYLLKHRQAIRLLARYLWESGQGGFNVPPAIKRTPEAEPVVLLRSQVEALYAACQEAPLGLRDRAMLALYYGCGLRRSEGVALDVTDVLLERAMVYVRFGKNYRERYVPLAAGVARDLGSYLLEARPVLAAAEERALLVSQRGRRIQGQSLLLRLRRLQDQVGALRDKLIGLHTLRHSVATHLLMAGMPLEEIAQFLGHQSLESTQRYTHLVDRLRGDGAL